MTVNTLPSPRLQRQDLLLTCSQRQYDVAQEASPRSYTPSAKDAATFTEANVAAASVGQIVIWEDGNCRGMRRQILSQAANVATLDAVWPAVPTGTVLRAWNPADVPVRVTAQGNVGKTTVISSLHAAMTNEPDHCWSGGTGSNTTGYYLVFIGGPNAGAAVKITDFAQSTGTFTITPALGTRSDVGDLAVIRKIVRPEGAIVNVAVSQVSEDRALIGNIDPEQTVIHRYAGSISFDMPIRPLLTAASAAAVGPLDLGDMLEDVFSKTLDTGTTATGAVSANVLPVTSASGLSVGGFVLSKTGEAAQIRSISSNNVTLGASQIAGVIANADVVYASAWYKRGNPPIRSGGLTNQFFPRTFQYYRGGLYLQELAGCLPKIDLEITRDKIVRLKMAYMAPEVVREYNLARPVATAAAGATYPFGLLDLTTPKSPVGMRTLFGGIAVTLLDFKMNPGFKPVERPSLSGLNQASAFMDYDIAATGSLQIYADNDTRSSFTAICDQAMSQIPIDFFAQIGTNPKETICLAIPTLQVTKTTWNWNAGEGIYACEWRAILPQSIPGNTYDAALPGVSLGLL